MRKKYAIFNIPDDNLCMFVYDYLNQSYGGDGRCGKAANNLTNSQSGNIMKLTNRDMRR